MFRSVCLTTPPPGAHTHGLHTAVYVDRSYKYVYIYTHIMRYCCDVMFDAFVDTGGHVQPAGDTERIEGGDFQGGQDTLLGLGRRPAQ